MGDRRKYLVALIVPAFAALRQWSARNGVNAGSDEELAADERVVALYTRLAEEESAKLARCETIEKAPCWTATSTSPRGRSPRP